MTYYQIHWGFIYFQLDFMGFIVGLIILKDFNYALCDKLDFNGNILHCIYYYK